MLNESFGVIYFHFNIFSEKNSKIMGVIFFTISDLENLTKLAPFHTTHFRLEAIFLCFINDFGIKFEKQKVSNCFFNFCGFYRPGYGTLENNAIFDKNLLFS